MLKILTFVFLSSSFLFTIKVCADIPHPMAQKPTDIIAPEKVDFKLYMNTDANHQSMENLISSLSVSIIERTKRENVIALLAPLMRLNVETVRGCLESI